MGGADERASSGVHACASLPSLAARARGHSCTTTRPPGTAESDHPAFYPVLSSGCTLELLKKLFKNLDVRNHSALLNQNLWGWGFGLSIL